MPWVLDGNNLAGGENRAAVRRAALELARRERVRVLLFFDGAPPPGSPPVERLGAVEVRYVPDADAAIAAVLAGQRGWVLVTNDRALGLRVRAGGTQVVGSSAFWQKLERAQLRRFEAEGVVAEKPETLGLDEHIERLPPAPQRVRRRVSRRRRLR